MKRKMKPFWHIDIIKKNNKSQQKIKKIKIKKTCCSRFKKCLEEKIIIHSNILDETEWYIPGGYHIYYCPFCGKYIKGRGFGKPEKYYKYINIDRVDSNF